VFVDPAGLHHIQGGGPNGAGGAARAIYEFLGINNDSSFPESVVAAVKETGDAKWHAYNDKHVIHAAVPDLRKKAYTWEEAVDELAKAYTNILSEFAGSGLPTLRLLPVSGGIFSGPFSDRMPLLTAEALQKGIEDLPEEIQKAVSDRHLQLCIFMEKELEEFEKVFGTAQYIPIRSRCC
jgi:O-acetyl-ADP-ribose deacetylase (regulator of RNase III)